MTTRESSSAQPEEASASKKGKVFAGCKIKTAKVYVQTCSSEENIPEERTHITIGIFFDGTLNNRKNTEARVQYELDKKKYEAEKKEYDIKLNLLKKTESETEGFLFKNALAKFQNSFSKASAIKKKKKLLELSKEVEERRKKLKADQESLARFRERKSFTDLDEDVVDLIENKEGSYENDYSNISKMQSYYPKVSNPKNIKFSIYIEGIGTENLEEDSLFEGGGFGILSTGIIAKVQKGCKKIIAYLEDNNIQKIYFLTFDVFGFSRGAAAARNFVHEMYKTERILWSSTVLGIKKHGYLGSLFREHGIEVRMLSVGFVGLYDTVASYGIKHSNDTKELNLDAVGKAIYTFQLAAADEHRVKFRLTNINSATGKGLEKFLPGVHSDIGGGYRDNTDENVKLIRSHKGFKEKLIKERQHLIDEGWYTPEEIKIMTKDLGGLNIIGYRKSLSNKYSHIPLQLMVEHALEKKLEFEIGELIKDYPIPEDLIEVKERLSAYVKGEAAMLSFDNPDDRPLLKTLRNKYLHFSANFDGVGMGPNIDIDFDMDTHFKRERVIQAG